MLQLGAIHFNQKERKIPQILIHTKSMYRVFKRGFSFLKLNRFTVENFPKLNQTISLFQHNISCIQYINVNYVIK